jgi:Cd2+/Zn2+-exporting ATPase
VGEGVIAEFSDLTCVVGNKKIMSRIGVEVSSEFDKPNTLFVAINNRLEGVIIVSDEIKNEAKSAIDTLRRLGIKTTYIISGDKNDNVKRTASEVGVDVFYAELSPEEKYTRLEEIIETRGCTMYVGDGINDSPSLARADVGIAMGGVGQDSAIEAADVVIMNDNLAKISEAVLIARKTINISWQNIVFALGVKGIILILGLLGFANMWLAVFADVGVAVLAILNSMRAMK